jgi:hypothetical protein
MTTYNYTVNYTPAYFNRTAHAFIPARWSAEIVSDLPQGKAIYTDGCASKNEAISELIVQAKKFGLSGNLHLVNN